MELQAIYLAFTRTKILEFGIGAGSRKSDSVAKLIDKLITRKMEELNDEFPVTD